MKPIRYCQRSYLTYGQMNLINDFRSLWTDITGYTRGYMLSSALGNQQLADAYSRRIYLIPEQFKSKLEPFFGSEIAIKFQSLLSDLLLNSQLLIKAYIDEDEALVNNITVNSYAKINELSEFLAEINPYWNKEEWLALLSQLQEMGMNELTAIVNGNYDLSLQLLDNTIKQTQTIGDYMAYGLLDYLSPKSM